MEGSGIGCVSKLRNTAKVERVQLEHLKYARELQNRETKEMQENKKY